MKYDNYMYIEALLRRIRNWFFSGKNGENVTTYSSINERQRIVEGVRRFFNENYELRYNVLKQTEEFRRKEPSIARQEPLISQEEPLISREVPPNFQYSPPNFSTEPLIYARRNTVSL